VVGEAAHGAEALDSLGSSRPDLVILDVDMPGMDGLETLAELRKRRPKLPVIMLSALTRSGAATTLAALAQGAVDFIDKSSLNLMDFERLSAELLDKIRVWRPGGPGRDAAKGPGAGRRKSRDGDDEPGNVEAAGAGDAPPIRWDDYRLLIVGASTGGPVALERLLREIPASFPLPIAVVQHMPHGFTRPFAERLNTLSALSVTEAVHGQRLERGAVVVAPAGQHLCIDRGLNVQLSREPANAPHRPSVDVTMYSAACALGKGKVAGVLLTGMGEDGAEGMCAIREKGGLTLAENEETCVVPGMPRTAYLRGGVVHYLPFDSIVRALCRSERAGSSAA
jgi:two-component system chemotaxis response regulator CheB